MSCILFPWGTVTCVCPYITQTHLVKIHGDLTTQCEIMRQITITILRTIFNLGKFIKGEYCIPISVEYSSWKASFPVINLNIRNKKSPGDQHAAPDNGTL